jgi:hypothetical protein
MTKYFRALTIAAILFTASSATAQEATQPTIGFGISYQSLDLVTLEAAGLSRVAFYLPINLGRLKLEPAVGFWSLDVDGGSAQRGTSLGVGVLYQLRQLQQTSFYAGGRFNLIFDTQEPLAEPEISSTAFRISAVGGGEHFLAPTFSIGAELQLGYLSRGEAKQSGVVVDPKSTLWQTVGVGFLRYYFM